MSMSRPPPRAVLGSNTSTNTHLAILGALLCFSFDQLNPVKRVSLLLFDDDDASYIFGWFLVLLLAWAVQRDFANLCFYAARIFLNAIMSIVISNVEVIGAEHIPLAGPVILVANHSNQFVDGMCVVCSVQQRKIGFLVARKSYNTPLVGFFARVLAAVPVTRPQDIAFKGSGRLLKLEKDDGDAFRLAGSEACRFDVEFTDGAKLRYTDGASGRAWVWRVRAVESHCVALLSLDPALVDPPADPQASLPRQGSYTVLPRGDYEEAFAEARATLQRGGAICLFPEGGSHDQPDLLELKPGVALIALGVSRPVPIVPIGLSYFRGHSIGAKVTVHIGPPIHVSEDERASHAAGGEERREATAALLGRIKKALRAVMVPAASIDELRLIHSTRRLWCSSRGLGRRDLRPAVRQDLDRRFAFAIRRVLGEADLPLEHLSRLSSRTDLAALEEAPSPPGGEAVSARRREVATMVARLRRYNRQLQDLGLRESQVQQLEVAPFFSTLFSLGHMVTALLLASLPSLALNLPVGVAAVAWARWRQQAALRGSKVKLTASDVVLSEKIKFSLVAVPLLWLSYATLLLLATPLSRSDVLTLLMVAPIASFLGVISVESGMIALRDLRPMLARLVYDRRRVDALKAEQRALQRFVRTEMDRLVSSDPEVKELYEMRGEVGAADWERLQRSSGSGGERCPT